MSYAIVDLDVDALPEAVVCPADRTGLAFRFRSGDRPIGAVMQAFTPGTVIDRETVRQIAGADVAERRLALALEPRPADAPPLPSLTIAICTKDRAVRLARLLDGLAPVVAGSPFAATRVIVVDNASSDTATHDVCARRPWARYVREPKAGLDFARNAALFAADTDLIAYLDDDVVVDAHWAHGLARAWRSRPDAGGFTGLVLAYRLDTAAQIAFEERGGFGRGFRRREVHGDDGENGLHPVGAGTMGAGCNMAFDRRLVVALGGFDEALDTGGPVPGGGDLDIFYRVLRSGRPMIYEPAYLVFHEHRETIEQLRRQYWTWGLGFAAFLTKASRHDPALRPRQRALVRWWLADQLRRLLGAWRHGTRQEVGFAWAELRGGLVGGAGEYDRSRRRVSAIRRRVAE
ncbi:glycosyltransferase family 2 protein [uncultured Sphingomonas sp.]|uniref:glycosyltransferase family 2 protein n=1 Tax=uncultured Sphingomonas sp. TaxID=158754 RepID=UPI0035C9C86B